LAVRFQETNRVLEMIGIHRSTECLNRFQRNTVTRVDVRHFSFGYDNERFFMNAVLPRILSEVNTAT
jgi:hypothetical protein